MRGRNGVSRIILAAFGTAAVSVILTGVAENAMSGMPAAQPAAVNILKSTGELCAVMAIPSFISGNLEAVPESTSDVAISTPQTDSDISDYSSISEAPRESSVSSSGEESVPAESTVDISSSVQPESCLVSLNISKAQSGLSVYTNRSGIIEQRFFGRINGDNALELENGQLRNCTDIDNSAILEETAKKPSIQIEKNGEPQVLIMHTHTTESYEPVPDGKYDPAFDGRSLCPSDSVVGIGAVIAQKLAENGICTIHDGTVFDDPVYSNSYSRSYERVKEILKEYPSIKVVLDIHRDGIQDGDVRIAPVTEINGREAAQFMIICGADDGTGILPNYKENLKFAAYLQNSVSKDYPSLARPMLFDYRYYNQDLTAGSLLIEVGALANTREQAEYTAELLGESLSKALLGLT